MIAGPDNLVCGLLHLATPAGLSFDKQGNLLVANGQTNEILSFSSDLKRETIATGLQTPVGAVITSRGSYFVSNINGGITLVTPDQKTRTINSQLVRPGPGITIDTSDHAYVCNASDGIGEFAVLS